MACPVEKLADDGEGARPLADVALLTAGVKRDAIGLQPKSDRGLHELAREIGVRAEFFGKGPVGAKTFRKKPEKHLRARGGARKFVDVAYGIGDKESHAFFIKICDIFLFFYCIPKTHAIGRYPKPQKLIQFIAGGDVEVRAEVTKKRDNCIIRICFDSIVDDRPWKIGLKVFVIFSYDFEIDDQAWCLFVFREFLDALEFFALHVVFEGKGVGIFH